MQFSWFYSGGMLNTMVLALCQYLAYSHHNLGFRLEQYILTVMVWDKFPPYGNVTASSLRIHLPQPRKCYLHVMTSI